MRKFTIGLIALAISFLIALGLAEGVVRIYAHINKLLNEDYQLVYDQGLYRIYARAERPLAKVSSNQPLDRIAMACRGGRLCPPQTAPTYTGATTEGRPYMLAQPDISANANAF